MNIYGAGRGPFLGQILAFKHKPLSMILAFRITKFKIS